MSVIHNELKPALSANSSWSRQIVEQVFSECALCKGLMINTSFLNCSIAPHTLTQPGDIKWTERRDVWIKAKDKALVTYKWLGHYSIKDNEFMDGCLLWISMKQVFPHYSDRSFFRSSSTSAGHESLVVRWLSLSLFYESSQSTNPPLRARSLFAKLWFEFCSWRKIHSAAHLKH